ncbi:MAG: phosphatase PAP2 family protein [Planctomycetaceae bacterium]|jgi:membrane-associated phospholipid phosphatase|nr:phosphatase PAP2 family protein [Planctomycetaceae bacterium]
MNRNNFLLYIQFVAVVFIGFVLAAVCNRFLDYPISSWFCENKFNVIERPNLPEGGDGVIKNINVTKITDGDPKVEDESASRLVGGSKVGVGGKLMKRLVGWILILEFFGHPLCFFVVLALCFLLDYVRRRNLFRFISCILLSQVLVMAIKFSVHRKRPVINDFSISSFDLTGFIGRDDIHSFPSGHSALAVAVALSLAWSYPRGRYLFYLLAVGVAFERIFDCRHYLSDTIVGGLIAYVVWFFCYKTSFIASLFNYFETTSDSDSDLKSDSKSGSKSDTRLGLKSKAESIQNKCNDNGNPTILFSATSLGSSSSRRFNLGIHQFLRSNENQIDHNDQQQLSQIQRQRQTPKPERMQNRNQLSNSQRVSKFENIELPAERVTDDVNDLSKIEQLHFQSKNPKCNRRRNNLPFDNFRK